MLFCRTLCGPPSAAGLQKTEKKTAQNEAKKERRADKRLAGERGVHWFKLGRCYSPPVSQFSCNLPFQVPPWENTPLNWLHRVPHKKCHVRDLPTGIIVHCDLQATRTTSMRC